MPIYEYACEKCEHEFELEQRISDPPAKTCPQCRSRKVKRLISRTSFVLKGSGWYSDLYASPKQEAKGGEAKSEGESKAPDKAASEGGSEAPKSGSGKGKGKAGSKASGKSKAAA